MCQTQFKVLLTNAIGLNSCILWNGLSWSAGSIWECHQTVICCVDILYNLWDASAMEVRATMPPLTLQNHRQTGGDNANHRDRLKEGRGEEMEKKGD